MQQPTMQEVTTEDGQKKYAISYTDEAGKVTSLTAESPAELVAKVAQSHLEASKALARQNKAFDQLSRTKPVPKPQERRLEPKPLTADESYQAGLDLQNPAKATEAVGKLVNTVIPVDEFRQELEDSRKARYVAEVQQSAAIFVSRHADDFFPCHANERVLFEWIDQNGLARNSVDNLELAFAATQRSLAQPPRQATNAVPTNDAPNNDAKTAHPAEPKQERRPPTPGLRNADTSGRQTNDVSLTRQQALEMLWHDRQKYEAWMADPQKRAILDAALARR